LQVKAARNMVTIALPPPASGILSYGLSPGTRAPELDAPTTPDGQRAQLSSYGGAPRAPRSWNGPYTAEALLRGIRGDASMIVEPMTGLPWSGNA
jgi:hypothetical protein